MIYFVFKLANIWEDQQPSRVSSIYPTQTPLSIPVIQHQCFWDPALHSAAANTPVGSGLST